MQLVPAVWSASTSTFAVSCVNGKLAPPVRTIVGIVAFLARSVGGA